MDHQLCPRASWRTGRKPSRQSPIRRPLLGPGFTGPAEGDLQTVQGGISGERFRRRFARCTVYWPKDRGAHEIHGEIREKYDKPLPDQVPRRPRSG